MIDFSSFSKDYLRLAADLCDAYVRDKPEHDCGLCWWLKNAGCGGRAYGLVERFRIQVEGPDCTDFVVRALSYHPRRAQLAAELADAIRLYLKENQA